MASAAIYPGLWGNSTDFGTPPGGAAFGGAPMLAGKPSKSPSTLADQPSAQAAPDNGMSGCGRTQAADRFAGPGGWSGAVRARAGEVKTIETRDCTYEVRKAPRTMNGPPRPLSLLSQLHVYSTQKTAPQNFLQKKFRKILQKIMAGASMRAHPSSCRRAIAPTIFPL